LIVSQLVKFPRFFAEVSIYLNITVCMISIAIVAYVGWYLSILTRRSYERKGNLEKLPFNITLKF